MDASLALLFFIFMAKSGEAIQCYECNSRDNASCSNELLLEEFKVDCSTKPGHAKYTLCRKIRQVTELLYGLGPHERIIRKCGWENSTFGKNDCYFRPTHGVEQIVCGCTKDYCNSGNIFSATFVTLVSLVLLHLFNQR